MLAPTPRYRCAPIAGRLGIGAWLAICLAATLGCRTVSVQPSNNRTWTPDQATLSYAEFDGDRVTVHNIRNCEYRSTDDFTVRHYDRTFDLNELATVDFLVVPFSNMPEGAHTMLSFGFEDGEHLALSIEIRREQGESFSAIKGSMRQYELMYVLGDERDLLGLRANHRHDDVYLYRSTASRAQARALLRDVLDRTNQLTEKPEFYDTLTNNCTTNILEHVNHVAAPTRKIPYGYQILLPGFSDQLAYDRGLIEKHGDFAATRQQARVNPQIYLARESPDFSVAIRR